MVATWSKALWRMLRQYFKLRSELSLRATPRPDVVIMRAVRQLCDAVRWPA